MAGTKVRGLTIELGADVTDLQKAFEKVRTDVNKTSKALRDVNSMLKLDSKSPEMLRQKQQYLNKAINETSEEIKREKEMFDELAKKNTTGELTEEQKALQRDIVANTAKLKEFIKQFAAMQSTGTAKLRALGQSFENVGKKLSALGSSLTMYVTTPLVTAGVAAVKMAEDVETSMQKVQSIVQANGDADKLPYATQLEEVTEASVETGVAIDDYNEALYQSISASVDASKAIGFTTDAVKLARGGFTTTEKAVDLLTTIMNSYGYSADEAEDIMDDLITTQNRGKTTVDQLASSMGKVIPIAKNYSVSMEQLNAGVADLTKKGIQTPTATMALRAMFNELGKSTGTAAKNLEEFTGMTFTQMMQNGYTLTDVLKAMSDGAAESGQTLGEMFGNTRSGLAATTLFADEGESFNAILLEMGDNAGVASEAFKTMDETPAIRLQKAINKLKNTAISIGYDLVPMVDEFAEKLGSVYDAYKKLTPQQKKALKNILLIAAATGPVIKVTGKLTTGVGKLMKTTANVIDVFRNYSSVADAAASSGMSVAKAASELSLKNAGLYKAFSLLASPTGVIVAATAALAAFVAYADGAEIRQLKSDLENTSNSFKEQTAEIDSNAAVMASLKDRVSELQEKEELTTEEQQELRRSVAQLNSAYPDLSLEIDSATGKVKNWTKAVESSIDAMVNQAIMDKYQDEIADISEEIADVTIKHDELSATLKYQQSRLALIDSQYKAGIITYEDYWTEAYALNQQIKDNTATDEVYSDSIADLTDQLNGIIGKSDQYSQAMETAQAQTAMNESGVNDLITSFNDLDATQQSAVQSFVQGMSDMAESAQSSVSSAMSIFDDFDKGTSTSLQSIYNTLQSNIDGVNEWEANLQILADSGVSEEIISSLVEAGPEAGYGYVSAMASAVKAAGSSEETNGAINSTVEQINEKFGEYFSTLDTSSFSTSLADSIAANDEEIVAAANSLGLNIGAGLSEGLAESVEDATSAAEDMDEAVIDQSETDYDINSPSKVYSRIGGYLSQGLANGVRSNIPVATSAMRALSNSVNSAMNAPSMIAQAQNLGAMIAAGLARGISSGTSSVINASVNMATAAIRSAQTTLDVHSPSKRFEWLGQMSGEGYAIGLTDSMKSVSGIVSDGFNSIIANPGTTNNTSNTVNITVNGSEHQSSTDIADVVMRKIQRQMNSKGAVWA